MTTHFQGRFQSKTVCGGRKDNDPGKRQIPPQDRIVGDGHAAEVTCPTCKAVSGVADGR